jgi:hypothetical protein
MSQEQAHALRHTYLSCIKLARETDSKKEDAYLKVEASKALEELRKVCTHENTVCLRSEYEGSSSMDYDDRYPEDRICLCCGITESAYNNKWKILTVLPFARFEDKVPLQVKEPLLFLLTEARDVAETRGYHYMGRVRWK